MYLKKVLKKREQNVNIGGDMERELLVRKINWAMEKASQKTLLRIYNILLALNQLQGRK